MPDVFDTLEAPAKADIFDEISASDPNSPEVVSRLKAQQQAGDVGRQNQSMAESREGLGRGMADITDRVHASATQPGGLLNAGEWTEAAKNFLPTRILNRIAGNPPDQPFIPKDLEDQISYAFKGSAGDVAGMVPGATPGFRKAVEGGAQSAADTGLSFVNPDIAFGGGLVKGGGMTAAAVKAAFATQMASAAPEAFQKTVHALKYGDETEIAKSLSDLAITTGLPLAIVGESMGKPKQPMDYHGSQIPMPKGARPPLEVLPEVIKAVKEADAAGLHQAAEATAKVILESPKAQPTKAVAPVISETVPTGVNAQKLSPVSTSSAPQAPAPSPAPALAPVKDVSTVKLESGREVRAEDEMGANTLGPLKEGDYVSNMFAAIDRDRASMGKPPMKDTRTRTWDEDNQKALAKMNREPDWIPRLINEVKEKPRPLLSWEQAGMVWHRNRLVAEAHNAMAKINQAFEDGRQDDLIESKQDAARFEDEILALDDVVGRNGTGSEAGRSLNAQRMGAGEDFTLVQMVLEKRAKKGGRPLTDTERSQVEKEHAEYERLKSENEAAQQRAKASEAKQADLESQLALERLKKEAKPVDPAMQRIINRIGATLHTQADLARARIRARTQKLSAGLDPTVLADVAIIGAEHIYNGLERGTTWAAKMIDEFGEGFRPHLDEIWKAANKKFDEITDRTAMDKAREANKRIKAMAPADRIGYTKGKISEKLKAGKNDEITNLVQKLARSIVEQNPNIDRDGWIDAIHEVLKDIDPKIERSEARDMISGYGDYRQLSKDHISVKVRDLKGQLQQVAKLEDMQHGRPPLKTGMERRVPSMEESRLLKLVNYAKREFQIPITGTDTQLKSSLDTLKKRMESRIQEYQDKLAAGDFSTKPKRPVHLDPDALRTQANLNRWKTKYERGKALDEQANRIWWQKTLEHTSGFARASALSGYHTLGKLLGYTAAKLVLKPVYEAAGAAFSKLPITRDIFTKTKFESPNVSALARYYTAFAREGMKEAKQQLLRGESDIKAAYGKQRIQPRKWYDFFGNLHASEKTPLRTGAFYSNLENAEAWAIRNGFDPKDEFVQGALRWDSSQEADREILQENNAVADEINSLIARMEKPSKIKDRLTGKIVEDLNPTKSAIATLFKTFVTKGIVKTPANYVMQSLEHTPAGLAFGLSKSARAWKAGVENLHPQQSDAIARLLKVGSVGTAMFVWGAIDATLSPNKRTFGGYYQPGDNRDKEDALFGTIRIPGVANKRWTHMVTHNPATEAAQMGSTFMRVALSKLSKKDKENKGALAGVIAATVGLANQAPIAGSGLRLAKIGNPSEQGKVVGDLIKGLIPQLVQNIAEDTDSTDDYRPPKTAAQDVELGIPGLRQTVPVKKSARPIHY